MRKFFIALTLVVSTMLVVPTAANAAPMKTTRGTSCNVPWYFHLTPGMDLFYLWSTGCRY